MAARRARDKRPRCPTVSAYQTAAMPDPDATTKTLKPAEAVFACDVIRFALHSGYELELPQMLINVAEHLNANLPRSEAQTRIVS